MNLTLVAYYGTKPDPLKQIIRLLQTALGSGLGPGFFPYAVDQVHATIVGLEGWRDGAEVFNSNTAQAASRHSAMNLHGLFQFMQGMPPLHIQIGGYSPSSNYPFTSRGLHPYLRSFSLNGTLAVMMGWPAADSAYPMTLDALRRRGRQYGILHKYHWNETDVDNDLFLVLGRVERKFVSEEKAETMQGALRQLLADQEPLDLEIRSEDISVVAYMDTQLPTASSVRYSLSEALASVDTLKHLYDQQSSPLTTGSA